MDARMLAVINHLSEDLANMEKALHHTQLLLRELAKETRRNGKEVDKRLDTIQATQQFLAGQQPRWSGTAPWHARREDDDD